MSAPTPQQSSIPRAVSAGLGGTAPSSSGPGHVAASRHLPALAHVKNISKKLDGHLKSSHVYDDIRAVLQKALADEQLEPSQQAEVLSALTSAGVFGDVLTGGLGPQVGFGYEPSPAATASSASSSSAASAASTHVLPGGGRLVPGKRYLNVRVKSGRAFVDNLIDDAEARTSGGLHVLRLSMELLGSRCVSAPVPATVEPNFSESFLFKLQDEDSEMEAMMPLEQLAEVRATQARRLLTAYQLRLTSSLVMLACRSCTLRSISSSHASLPWARRRS